MKFLYCVLLVFVSFKSHAANLEIELHGISKPGILNLAIFDSKKVFETYNVDKSDPQPGVIKKVRVQVSSGSYKNTYEIPNGVYSISLFIDVNGNQEFDTNFLGLPKEQYGFSNNAMGTFGPPKFEPASFILDGYKKIKINL